MHACAARDKRQVKTWHVLASHRRGAGSAASSLARMAHTRSIAARPRLGFGFGSRSRSVLSVCGAMHRVSRGASERYIFEQRVSRSEQRVSRGASERYSFEQRVSWRERTAPISLAAPSARPDDGAVLSCSAHHTPILPCTRVCIAASVSPLLRTNNFQSLTARCACTLLPWALPTAYGGCSTPGTTIVM